MDRNVNRQEELVAFLDGELPQAEHAALAERLETAADLARELEDFRAVDALLDLYDVAPHLGDGVEARVRQVLKRETSQRVTPARVIRMYPLIAAAAVLLLVVGIVVSLMPDDSPDIDRPLGGTSETANTADAELFENLIALDGMDSGELALLMTADADAFDR